MTIRTTAIAMGVAALLGAGSALAQSAPPYGQPGPGYPGGYQGYQGPPPYQGGENAQPRHHHGVIMLLNEEVRAGRMSEKEFTLIKGKIRALHAERRAAREAGASGRPPQGQMPPSQ